jgi:hypothetical protein
MLTLNCDSEGKTSGSGAVSFGMIFLLFFEYGLTRDFDLVLLDVFGGGEGGNSAGCGGWSGRGKSGRGQNAFGPEIKTISPVISKSNSKF